MALTVAELRKRLRCTGKPAQVALGTGTTGNGLSTYEASSPRYGYPEEEWPWKVPPKRKLQVMACL